MSKKLHWFPFYYLDWLSDSEVAMMTYSEKGLFIDMLSRCFNEDGLPADEKKLLRLFKCDADDLQECVKMFYKNGEKLFNKKLDSIKKDQKKISTGRSKAGKASAEARKAKRLTEGTNDEQVLNPVATNLQQNPTNTTQQNTVQQNTINYIEMREERKQGFRQSLTKHWNDLGGNKYLPQDEIRKFFSYWSEHGEQDRKFRKEKEKSFDVKKRLGTWKRNIKPQMTGSARP